MKTCKRIIFKTAARFGRLDVFKEVKKNLKRGYFRSMREYDTSIPYPAALHGQLELLKWMKEHSWFNKFVCVRGAAEGGHIECLKWLLEVRCSFTECTFSDAARGRSVEMLEFLLENECPFDQVACVKSAAKGCSLESLKWLKGKGCSFNKETFSLTIIKGDLEVMKRLLNNGCPFDPVACMNQAVEKGDLEVVKWLKENGGSFDKEIFFLSVVKGKLEIMQWLLNNECPFDSVSCMNKAVEKGDLVNIKWLK